MTRLVTSLLDMTRIDSGALEVRHTTASVPDLVREASDTLRASSGIVRSRWRPDDLPAVAIDGSSSARYSLTSWTMPTATPRRMSVITVAAAVRDHRIASR